MNNKVKVMNIIEKYIEPKENGALHEEYLYSARYKDETIEVPIKNVAHYFIYKATFLGEDLYFTIEKQEGKYWLTEEPSTSLKLEKLCREHDFYFIGEQTENKEVINE